ncbi:MAG: hypothetical protein CMJ26_05725 [Phycisphaerae bacterium]|nr:hypothetical protein [Phycisphaerae bacterium]
MKFEDGTSRTFDINQDRTTIGSRRSCDLHIAIPTIAPLHCEITLKDGLANLTNSDPNADTLHNNSIVESTDLMNEDIVKIGPVEFTVEMNHEETVIRRL